MIQNIDSEKCIGCGTCQKVCPLDVFRLKLDEYAGSACAAACPIHHNINEYHYLLQMGDVEGAARLMWHNNPLAAISARVCPRYCESECSRKSVDSAVNIAGIEQFLGDYALELEPAPFENKHLFPVAIVGAGPSGLTCAANLAEEGFRVTVFDEHDEPGGMLRYGVPEHRLPPWILGRVLEKLRASGVQFECGKRFGRDFSLPGLSRQSFGAVYLALGASKASKSNTDGIEGDGVFYALDFLSAIRRRQITSISGRAVVVGGGDVAVDVAETLIRLGSQSVTVVTLESEKELPALKQNVDSARSLGVNFLHSAGITRLIREGGLLTGAELVRCTRVFNDEGMFAPSFDTEHKQNSEADIVVFAIGQTCDLDGVPTEIRFQDRLIKSDTVSRQTALPFVFSGGDATTGGGSVAGAIAAGRQAAQGIALFLRGGDLKTLKAYEAPQNKSVADLKNCRPARRYDIKTPEQREERALPADRAAGYRMLEALAESNRCLTCGSKARIAYADDCMTCFACELNCPADAIFVSPIKEEWPKALAPLPAETQDQAM